MSSCTALKYSLLIPNIVPAVLSYIKPFHLLSNVKVSESHESLAHPTYALATNNKNKMTLKARHSSLKSGSSTRVKKVDRNLHLAASGTLPLFLTIIIPNP